MELGLLSASSFVNLAINRVVDKEAVDVDSLSLSIPPDTTDGLSLTHYVVLQCFDMKRMHKNHVISSCEVRTRRRLIVEFKEEDSLVALLELGVLELGHDSRHLVGSTL